MANKVIIVKKDEGMQAFLGTFFLRFLDAEIECYPNGERALENIHKHNGEKTIIVIGYRYDDSMMNGIDFAKEVREHHENIVIVMISGYGTESFNKEAAKAGIDLLIEIPFDLRSVREKILQAVSQ